MSSFLTVTFSYPTVIFTVLLGVAVAYWIMVIVGALGVDALDIDGDGLAEGAAEGAAEGLAEGAAEGAAEGLAEGAAEGASEGAAEASSGLLSGLLHFFKLRNAPMTLVLSVMFLFSWLFSHAATTALGPRLAMVPQWLWGSGVLVGSLVAALPLTSVFVRPLGRLLTAERQTSRSDVVGKVVNIDTSRVDATFGTAKFAEEGNAHLIQVRCDGENGLTRGDRALVVSYDESRRAYEVAPVDDILPSKARDN